jgi:hypothetical protein
MCVPQRTSRYLVIMTHIDIMYTFDATHVLHTHLEEPQHLRPLLVLPARRPLLPLLLLLRVAAKLRPEHARCTGVERTRPATAPQQ